MAQAQDIGIGLMGVGVVGSGVATALHEKAGRIEAHVGAPVRLKRVLVRDATKVRPSLPRDVHVTSNADDLLTDRGIAIVVEAMGGEQPAFDYIQRALHTGKHVVTANKEVLAKHGPELFAHAAEHGVSLRFEASVGGGIPIIGPLLSDLLANDLTAVHAIINGTTNYMLTRMAHEGLDYADVLRQAQHLGYAEADPTNDVDGIDAAYKLAILASLAFQTTVRDSDVFREGIRKVTAADFRYAAELGYAIKLLAIGKRVNGSVEARVHPAMVPLARPLAKVDDVLNAVELEGDLVGWAMFEGPGAGSLPTTSAVMGDILRIAEAVASGGRVPAAPRIDRVLPVQPMADLRTKYYLRLRAFDRPGVMARVTKVLGDLQVSLAGVIQKETIHADGVAEIVVTTHAAREADVQEAVRLLGKLDVVREVANLIRVEDTE
ncbi:MAG: homoserine dehydrogenase [SAR202 cluster bacterium]|nr:homoserine dehydrogenase [SAR202 cluster bacterium]